ncbi:hypothetical protein K439DRAFT_1649457 [Ramaria rubella]|nr:hypothetical protein K439DRAFT_1649457 [Ramaria rubella]
MIWAYLQLDDLPMTVAITSHQKGGHWQYLTIQGCGLKCFFLTSSNFTYIPFFSLAAAALTMLFGFAADNLPIQGNFTLFCVCVVVAVIYWTLLVLYPTLIIPIDPNWSPDPLSSSSTAPPLLRVPFKLDLALHATPTVALVVDFFVFQAPYSPNDVKYVASAIIVVAGVWYGALSEYLASYNKTFPYPFLTENILEVRIIIYAGATLLASLMFRGLNRIHPLNKTEIQG